MMIPITVRLIPSYNLCRNLNMLDTYMGMILPQVAWSIPFGTFLMRQFYMGIPKQLDEAAKIDGASHFQIFWKILLPNTKSSMTTLGIYTFISAWNTHCFHKIFTRIIFRKMDNDLSLLVQLKSASHKKDNDVL